MNDTRPASIMLTMSRRLHRLILTVFMAFAIVFPPVSDALACALGGSGEHHHYDHVWHHPGASDADHDHDNDGKPHSCLDHVHMTVMVVPEGSNLMLETSYRGYDVVAAVLPAGRILAPPGHPPQLRA